MNKLYLMLLCAVVGVYACRQGDAPKKLEDCPYGKPKPIFSEEMPGVKRHVFVEEPYTATEEFTLGDTLQITIIQSGCEAPVQEFRFSLPRRPAADDAALWVKQCVDILYGLSALSTQTAPLSAWAQAIEVQIPNFVLGESLEIQQGTYVEIDRIPSAEGVILMLILGAEP